MTAELSLLVVSSAPDERSSSRVLEQAVDALDSLDRVSAELWYLAAPRGRGRSGSLVVDDLRTWELAMAVERRMPVAAAHLRGFRLRSWYRRIAPDVLVLDDGIGRRVAPRHASPLVVVRNNARPPYASGEAVARSEFELLGLRSASGVGRSQFPDLVTGRSAVGDRAAARSALGLPEEPPIVVGWTGRLEDARHLVEVLAILKDDGAARVHGLWLDDGGPAEVLPLVRDLAVRRGVGDRLHVRPAGPHAEAIGDLALAAIDPAGLDPQGPVPAGLLTVRGVPPDVARQVVQLLGCDGSWPTFDTDRSWAMGFVDFLEALLAGPRG